MADLTPADVQTYTKGRLQSSDAEVIRMLDAALMVARREVRWHVSPVRTAVTMTLDGPGSRVLFLPTQKVTALTSVTEDGTLLDISTVKFSVGDGEDYPRRAALRKTGGDFWSSDYAAIELVLSHGFTEDQAADWRQAILSMVDQMSLLPISGGSGTSPFGVKSERIDDVAYTYDTYAAMAEGVLFSAGAVIARYRLPDIEFF